MTEAPKTIPSSRVGWVRIFAFLDSETRTFAQRVRFWCAVLIAICGATLAVWGVKAKVDDALESWRKGAEAQKAQVAAQIEAAKLAAVVEDHRLIAEAAKILHDQQLEALVLETRKIVDSTSTSVKAISSEQKINSATIKAMRLDIASLLKEKGLPSHPVALGGP